MKHVLAPLLCACLLSSCFVSRDRWNEPLRPAAVGGLTPGVSSADDVLAALGAPTDVVQLGRRSAWRYDFAQTKRAALFLLVVTLVNTDLRQDRVWVFFDQEERLTHVGGTYEAERARYAMPWKRAD